MPGSVDLVYVTGASGFLGRRVCKALASDHVRVVAVSRRPLALPNSAVVPDYAQLKPELPSALVHLAEPASIPGAAAADPSKATGGTLDALLAHDWSAVVYASSAAVYGDADEWPHTEDEDCAPTGAYARAKLDNEAAVRKRAGTALRFSNIIGVPAKPQTVLSAILDQLGGHDPVALRSLAPLRDFVCVDDAAQAVVAALAGPPGVYNIASGEAVSIGELARHLLALAGQPDRPLTAQTPDVERSVLRVSIDAAKAQLGWVPQISLEDCLRGLLNAQKGSP
ncbi:MAG: NAD(P)-dependent oxidoreductase [Rhodobacteraceae bacterium]|nr:NAD(P)-dependent oxidoreductase [Paracoccaceae bacterium]